MANELKSASTAHAPFAWGTVYTCPVGKTAVVISAIGSNTAETNQTQGVSLAKNTSGTRTTLAREINVTTSASVSLLPAKLALVAGESVDARIGSVNYLSRFERSVSTTPLPSTPSVQLSNGTNTIIAVFASTNGIWRSTDGGDTWTQVNTTATLSSVGAYIGTTWFIYINATSALKSTDGGATWSAQAVTNAPTVQVNVTGSIVKNGSTYAGMNSATVMSTTTDGITWTTTTALPQACYALTFSGTHYIAGRASTTSEVYRSTDGASWATVAIPALTSGIYSSYGGLVSNGSGTVIAGRSDGNVCSYSTDHGATWSSGLNPPTMQNGGFWTGSVFFLRASGNQSYISTDGITWSTSATDAFTTASYSPAFTASKVVLSISGGPIAKSASLSMPAQYSGAAVTISVMEVA